MSVVSQLHLIIKNLPKKYLHNGWTVEMVCIEVKCVYPSHIKCHVSITVHVYYQFLLISAVCTKEIQCCNGKYNV